MQLKNKQDLHQLISEELKLEPITTHIDELWVVVNRTRDMGINVSKENLVEYYLTCCKYDNLKD
jgi:RNAse (barnase) inhibitor barstar